MADDRTPPQPNHQPRLPLAEARAVIRAMYPVTPPPSPIRRSYRSRPAIQTSSASCPNFTELAQILHTMDMDKSFHHIELFEQTLEELSNKDSYTDEECARQESLFIKIEYLKNRYRGLQKTEDLEFPIRVFGPLKPSMKRRSHSC